MSSSADRLAAARLLLRVEEGAFASRLLAAPGPPGVRVRVLGVLRQLRLLDAALDRVSSRPVARMDSEVRVTLRLGLFDGCCLGVPVPVATDAAVRLVRRLGASRASGLVNAVLRRAAVGWAELVATAPPDLRLSHPRWLARRWTDRFGAERAERMMAADQQPAPVWAWLVDDGVRRSLETDSGGLRAHPWCPDAVSPEGETRGLMERVESGDAYVQDPSSQLVSHLALALAPEGAERAADLCAAPGGKAALLARGRTWEVLVAGDVRLPRVRLASCLLSRAAGGVVVTIAADGTRPALAPASWDLVLLDAPCSGTGTLRRHPELRWRLRPEDVAQRAALQRSLLSAALPLLAPGGVLVYATCSLEPEENQDVVSDLPAGWRHLAVRPALPAGAPALETPAAGVVVPVTEDGDGFTVHAVRRRDARR